MPPVQVSDWLTVGSPEAYGTQANFVGRLTTQAIIGDLRFDALFTDIRNKADLKDYTGELKAELALRVTDRRNSAGGTTSDVTFTFAIPCAVTAASTTGGRCPGTGTHVTTANAILGGAIVADMRTIWSIPTIKVFDGGSDGVASTGPNTLFLEEGAFIP